MKGQTTAAGMAANSLASHGYILAAWPTGSCNYDNYS